MFTSCEGKMYVKEKERGRRKLLRSKAEEGGGEELEESSEWGTQSGWNNIHVHVYVHAVILSYILICVGLLLCFKIYFSKLLRLLAMCIF